MHIGAQLIILTDISEATIHLELQTLLEQGRLHTHTLPVA